MTTRETDTGERSRREGRAPSGAWRHWALAASFACLAWLSPVAARAQDAIQNRAAAEALYAEGRRLMYQGSFEEACRRFQQSQALDPGIGTQLYLADCYDQLGRTASAWVTYREAEQAALAAGDTARAQVARERAAKNEPQLSRLTVQVADANPREGLEVTINGTRLNPAVFGSALPVDPGRYEVVARGLGRKPWTSMIEIQTTASQTLQVPLLEPAAEATPLPAAADPYAASAAAPAPAAALDDTGGALSTRKRAAIFVGAGGVAAIATGVVLGLVAKGKDDEANDICGNGCADPARAESLNDQAQDWALGANIAYVIGGVAVATAGALYFWPEKQSPTSARHLPLDISAKIGPRGGILTLGGTL